MRQERGQRIAEQMVEVLIPQIGKDIVEESKRVPQERIFEQIVEVSCPPVVEQLVEVPKILVKIAKEVPQRLSPGGTSRRGDAGKGLSPSATRQRGAGRRWCSRVHHGRIKQSCRAGADSAPQAQVACVGAWRRLCEGKMAEDGGAAR